MSQPFLAIEQIGGYYYVERVGDEPTIVVQGQLPKELQRFYDRKSGIQLVTIEPQFPNQLVSSVAKSASLYGVAYPESADAIVSTPSTCPPSNFQTMAGHDRAWWNEFNNFKKKLLSGVNSEWRTAIGSEFDENYFKRLCIYLFEENRIYPDINIYPPPELVFDWANVTPISDIRVVIIGQDPYFKPHQANGLAFSVRRGVGIPRSLKTIYKELKNDIPGFKPPKHGDLRGWARQGVLLLNSVLTVLDGSPNSHKNRGWERFIDAVVEMLTWNTKNLVFMLWGKDAQQKGELIVNHHVLWAAHPACRVGFSGCKHFSLCNKLLEQAGSRPIDWTDLPQLS